MRLDKLTTKFQEALADAQTLALAHDNPYIEPAHLLAAMLRRTTARGAARSAPASTCRACWRRPRRAMHKLPQVQGQEQVQVGRDLVALLQAAEKEAHQARRPVHRQRAVPAGAGRHQAGHRPHRARATA